MMRQGLIAGSALSAKLRVTRGMYHAVCITRDRPTRGRGLGTPKPIIKIKSIKLVLL